MGSYSDMSALITKRWPIAAVFCLLFLLMSVGCSSLWPKPAETEPAGSEATVAETPPTEAPPQLEEPSGSPERAESGTTATSKPLQDGTEQAVTESTPEKPVPTVVTPAPAPAAETETVTVTAEKAEPTTTPSPQPQVEKPVEKEMKAPGSVTAEAPTKETPPPLDLDSLEKRLRGTRAIGVFTKLALKNQVDDLLDKFRDFYQGRSNASLAQLRQPFELLVMKILALLQDRDPTLARDLLESREAIWKVLSDREKFTSI